MKWLLTAIFIVRVTIPFGTQKVYEAQTCANGGEFWRCTLTNGLMLNVPVTWTVIEERKDE